MNILFFLLLIPSVLHANPVSLTTGFNIASLGGIVVHDFKSQGTLSGIQWDALHISYDGNEVGEVGSFVARRDGDNHFLVGPSIGTPGVTLAAVAEKTQELLDIPVLGILRDYGKYVHAYVNIGWDLSNVKALHADPNLIGLGGVLKFGR